MSAKATYEITLGEQVHTVHVQRSTASSTASSADSTGETQWTVQIDDGPIRSYTQQQVSPGIRSLLSEGRCFDVGTTLGPDTCEVNVLGRRYQLDIIDPRRKSLSASGGAGSGSLKSQMPGRVIRLLVQEGDTVAKGDPVIVVEAMKMENEIKAPCDGTVRQILVEPGSLVESGTMLLEITQPSEDA